MTRLQLLLSSTAFALSAAPCRADLHGASAAWPDPSKVARVEGLSRVAGFFSPAIALQYPGLSDFTPTELDGEIRKIFSGSIFSVLPGKHRLTVHTDSLTTGGADYVLEFNAEAGKKYLLRPYSAQSLLGAQLTDTVTGGLISKSPSDKPPAAFTFTPGARMSTIAGEVPFQAALRSIARSEGTLRQTAEFELMRVRHLSGRTAEDIKRGVNAGEYTVELWYLLCDRTREDRYKVRLTPSSDGPTQFVIESDGQAN